MSITQCNGSMVSSGDWHMAGRIGSVQAAPDGKTYGFIVYDETDRAWLYLGFGSWHHAARDAGVACDCNAVCQAVIRVQRP
jgi:hypothetical protein